MNRPTSTRGRPIGTAGLLLLAGLLLCGLPAAAQAIKVTSVVPNAADQGTVGLVVTIGGENFGKSSKVNFYVTQTTNPGGITVRNVNYKNPQTLEATIDVAPDAQTDLKFDIQVMSNGRTGKGTELFKVNVKVTGGDMTPPGTITDLRVVDGSIGFNTAVLSWTAPADDGYDATSGPAAKYDLRVRKAACGPYTMDIWVDDTMTGIWNDPCHVHWARPTAGAPGTTETNTAMYLSPNTEYWAAIRTVDDSPQGPNWSVFPDQSKQLLFNTGPFPPAGWTAPWSTQIVDACPVVGTSCKMYAPPRLDFDLAGKPAMLYAKGSVPTLASWTGVHWLYEATPPVDGGNFAYDFAFDPSSGDATIASFVPNPMNINRSDLKFYRRIGTTWQTETFATGVFVRSLALGFDPRSFVPTVAYRYEKGSSVLLKVAQRHGASWTTETAASGVSGSGGIHLTFDADANPAVIFSQNVNGSDRLAFALRKGGAWTVELVEGPLGTPWNAVNGTILAFDSSRGDVSAVGRYWDAATSNSLLRFCQRANGSWNCETVAQGYLLAELSIAVARNGAAYIAYKQFRNFFMLVRKPGATEWTAEYIDWNVWGSSPGDLHVGPDGLPAIVYGSANDATGAGGSDLNFSVSFARRNVPAQ